MREPSTMLAACELLRARLSELTAQQLTLGGLLDVARTVQTKLPDRDGEEGDDVRLQFRSYPCADARRVAIELVWHWPRPEQLDAPPGRLWLRFDVDASSPPREVDVRSRDYPHIGAFVRAALDAAELETDACASDVHLELEREHMS